MFNLNWEEIYSVGKKTRSGIFKYIQNPEYAGSLIPLLFQHDIVGKDKNLGLSFHPKYSGILPYRYILEELKYFFNNDFPGKHKLVKSSLESIFEEKDNHEQLLYLFLFKAFIAAEIRFSTKFIPQNSHEERLTGHLLSESIFCLDLIKKELLEMSKKLMGVEMSLDFHYADVASNSNEAKSGADFGVILMSEFPDSPKLIKAFKFQAKIATSTAKIDIKQFNALHTAGKESGSYYVFYCLQKNKKLEEGLFPPLVLSTIACKRKIDAKKEDQRTFTLSKETVYKETIPFSAFLMLEGLDPDSNIGYRCDNLEEAAHFIYSNNQENLFDLSRLVVISIGAGNIPKNNEIHTNRNYDGNFLFRYPRIFE